MDGVTTTNPGGWWNHNWVQLGYQIAAALTCAAWSFFISCLLLFVINKVPGLHIRESDDDELQGLDRKYFSDADLEGMNMSQYGFMSGSQGHVTGAAPSSEKDIGSPAVAGPSTEQKRD